MTGGHETGVAADSDKLTDIETSPSKDQQDDETGFRLNVEKLLLCPVCHEIVTDPRQLNCGHFLCYECIQLLQVEDAIACPKCSARMTVPKSGIRVDELAAGLLKLLAQFQPCTEKTQNGSPQVNGIDRFMDEEDEESESDSDTDSSSENSETTTDDADDTPADVDAHMPPAADASVDKTAKTPAETPADAVETPTNTVETPADTVVTPVDKVETPADTVVKPTDTVETPADMVVTPADTVETPADTAISLDKPQTAATENAEGVEIPEVILDPPKDYQSPDEGNDAAPSNTTTTIEKHEPVEHDATQSEDKASHSEKAEEMKEETKDEDEPDRVMKASEMKPSEATSLGLEAAKQCEDCHGTKCTCNVSSLKPPVSNGSQLSVETTTSNATSESDDMDILVKKIAKFPVSDSASKLEVANRNRIYVTRWSYDDKGSVATFDCSGNKIKLVKSGRHNFGGITISRLGFIFAINTSKNRVEEYSGADGRKVKDFKLAICADPQAIDILSTGELIVVDQDKNRVIIYPAARKGTNNPKILKNDLIKDPRDVAACAEGFYITCVGSRCLLKMDLNGSILWKYTGQDDESTKEPTIFVGVCVDESGNVYVVDRDNERIIVLTKDGDVKGRIKVRERAFKNQKPWYVSVRDTILAVLFSHNTIRTYQLLD